MSHTCSVLWLAVRRWCHTFMCTRSINSGSSLSWQRKLMISFMVPTKPDWSGLVLSTQNLSYNSEFVNLPSWYRPLIPLIKSFRLIWKLHGVFSNGRLHPTKGCISRLPRHQTSLKAISIGRILGRQPSFRVQIGCIPCIQFEGCMGCILRDLQSPTILCTHPISWK